MTTLEYSPWHTPHTADPGAVERAIIAAAGELAYAEKWENDYKLTGIGKELADQQGQWARRLAFFVTSKVGDHEVCDLDRYLERARSERPIGHTAEQAYADAIRDYITHG